MLGRRRSGLRATSAAADVRVARVLGCADMGDRLEMGVARPPRTWALRENGSFVQITPTIMLDRATTLISVIEHCPEHVIHGYAFKQVISQ